MTKKNEIKGILVTFFRNGTKGDYLEALNTAVSQLTALTEANKITFNTVLGDSLPPCSKCGMPSHPVFGALCAMEDCIGKRR